LNLHIAILVHDPHLEAGPLKGGAGTAVAEGILDGGAAVPAVAQLHPVSLGKTIQKTAKTGGLLLLIPNNGDLQHKITLFISSCSSVLTPIPHTKIFVVFFAY